MREFFRKNIRCVFASVSAIILMVLQLFVSCEEPTFNEPVRSFLDYYTETAAVERHEIVQPYLIDKDGNVCLSCYGEDPKEILLYMRNPKDFPIVASGVSGTGVSISQDSDDPSILHLFYTLDYLQKHDCGEDIGGTISLTESVTPREFTDTYDLKLKCNSPPLEVTDAAIMSLTETDGRQIYVLAFKHRPNVFYSTEMKGVDRDVVSITINGESFPVSISSEGVISFSDERFTRTRPGTLVPINRKFDHSSLAVYFISGEELKDEVKSYSVGFNDEAGLGSSISLDTSVPRLSAPVVKNNDGTVLSAGSAKIVHIDSGDNVLYSTLSIEVPTTDELDEAVDDVSLFWELYQVDEETAEETKIGPDDSDSPSTENVSVRIPTEGWYRLRTWGKKGGYKDSSVLDYRINLEYSALNSPSVKNNAGNALSSESENTIRIDSGDNIAYSTLDVLVPTKDENDNAVSNVDLYWELYSVDTSTGARTKIAPSSDSETPVTTNASVRVPSQGHYLLRTWAKKIGYKDSEVLEYSVNLVYATLNPPSVKNLGGSALSLNPTNNLLEFDSGQNYATVKISPPSATSDGTSVSGATIKYKINRGTAIEEGTNEESDTSEVSLNSATLGQWFLTVKASKTGYNDSEEKSYRIKVFSSDIWVKSAGNGGNDTTGDGSSAAPFATVQKAVSEFASYNKSSGDYRIHVSGTVTGNQTIGNTLNGKASKLTLIGESTGILDGNGSGIVLNVTSSVPVTIKSLTIKNGNASQGGGINIASSATVTLDSGTVMESNRAMNYGGAIYNGGTLNMTGSVNLYTASNAEKYNDVYLPSGKYINIVDSLSATTAATVTPYQWKRGTQVLSGNATTTNCGKIKVSADGWSVVLHDSKGKIDAPLYVKNDGNDSTKKGGTSSDAYKTISKAASECWDSTKNYTINIVGEVKGTQEIPSSVTTSKAKSILLTGASTPVLNGDGRGPVLKVSTTVPVTITSLKITGGETDYGAGLCVNSGTVKLGNGVVIAGNEASYYGGGVHITSGAKLFVYGSALIGDGTTTAASSGNNANSATLGGGGISNYGSLYLGYSDESTPVALTGGVKHNYATWGGGIRTNENATVLMRSGSVSYNGCANGGGGICLSGGSVTITGGTIEGNHAVGGGEGGGGGGGILFNQNATSLDLQGGTFTSNSTGSIGGAINAKKTFSMSGGVSIPCSAQKNNDIYLSADSSNPSVKIDDDFSGTGSFWISGNSSVYNESYYALTGSKVSSYFCKFRVFKNGTQDWTILTGGKMAKAKLLSSSNIGSFSISDGQNLNLIIDSNCTEDQIKTFLKNICDSTINTEPDYVGTNSTLDLSRISGISSIQPPNVNGIGFDNRITQPFSTVILPADFPSTDMQSFTLHNILGAKSIVVPPESTSWCSVDGIVYNKAKTSILWYPRKKTGSSFTIPSTVTSVGKMAFAYTEYLNTVSIPTSVTSLGDDSFYESKITSMAVPSSVTRIGSEAFCDCTNLATITLPSSLSTLGYRSFQNCTSLTTISIPSSITTIEEGMFRWCTSLTSITIPNSITSIEAEAFNGCTSNSLTISVPANVKSLGSNVFYQCKHLNLSNMTKNGWKTEAGTSVASSSINESYFTSGSPKITRE